MSKKSQLMLFDTDKISSWYPEWQNMPEFKMNDNNSFRKIVVHFSCQDDINKFAELIGQRITRKQLSLWFPEQEIRKTADKRYVDES